MSGDVAVKSAWKSKTLWANVIVAGLAFFPSIADKVTPVQVALALTVLNTVLRLVTKDRIVLS